MKPSHAIPVLSLLRFAGFLVALALAPSVHASDPPAETTADQLFQSAKEAMARGDLAAACAQFTESQRLDPAAGTLLNLADCEERSGRLATALDEFLAARRLLPADDYRVSFAEERAASLERRVARLTVRVQPGNAADIRVTRNGALLGPSLNAATPLDAGRHVIVVQAKDRAETRLEVTLHDGEQRTVDVAVGPPLDAGRGRSAEPTRGTSNPRDDRGSARAIAFAVAGTGIAALGVGVVTGIMTIDAANTYKDHCKAGICDPVGQDAAKTGNTTEIVSPVAFGVGAAAIGVSAYLLLTTPSSPPKRSLAVAPIVGAGVTGISVTRAFE